MVNTILAKRVNHIVAKGDNPAWPKGSKSRGFSTVYITFLIIGIIGYFTIPTVANWIVQAGGGAGNYGKNVNQTASKAGSIVGGATGAAVGNVTGRLFK